MKGTFILTAALFLGGLPGVLQAQWTLEGCQEKALANYPQIRQYALIQQSSEYTLSNAGKAYLPQFSLSGKASYQSEVTKIPVDIPGVREMAKDQYSATIDATQSLWDGGVTHASREIEKKSAAVSKRQLDVDLYAIKDRVNQLYFGILLLDAKLEQNKLLQDELERNRVRIGNYMQNGVANQTDMDAVRVEQLKAVQQQTQLQTARKAYVDVLAYFTGQDPTGVVSLQKPSGSPLVSDDINRPELTLFDARQEMIEAQRQKIRSGYLPKFSLFVTGGYGRPGLNMLERDFSFYYMGGVRLSWNFGSLYTMKNERRILDNNRKNVEIQRETFLFNTNMDLTREQQEINKNRELLQYDDEIIRLRASVKKAAEAKVANGTLSVTDWMDKVTEEDRAKQDKIQHEIEFLQAIYNWKYTTDN